MFNFSFLKCYQKKSIFCVSVFVVATNFILSSASAVTDNSYKNKIYTNLDYMNIDSNKYIMLYGIGAEAKLPNSTEILCNFSIGNTQLKGDFIDAELLLDPQSNTLRPIFFILKSKNLLIGHTS